MSMAAFWFTAGPWAKMARLFRETVFHALALPMAEPGQWGNGINVFRAGNVMVSNNMVSDCAFSAIRSNAGNDVQITGNTCLRSGETSIYSEFEFNGAVINNNIIDGGGRGISIANFLQGGRLAVVSGNLIRNINTPPTLYG